MDHEQRLTRLEELLMYFQKTVDDLNGVVTTQAGQLDRLERRLGQLDERLRRLLDDLEEDRG